MLDLIKSKQDPDFQIFSMYDSKVDSYDMPMFAINQFDMIRQIQNLFENTQERSSNKFYLNAEDFSLFQIGTYTKKQGSILCLSPKHIVNLHELKATVQQKGIVST